MGSAPLCGGPHDGEVARTNEAYVDRDFDGELHRYVLTSIDGRRVFTWRGKVKMKKYWGRPR